MSHHCSVNNPILNLIPNNLKGITILDCGFGYGYWGYSFKVRKDGDPVLIGIEIFAPYIEKVKKTGIYEHLIYSDIRCCPLREYSVDYIIAIEILEHIKREWGLKLINELYNICKYNIIISTPFGFLPTKGYDENEHQIHKASFFPKDFKEKGFSVIIINKKTIPRSLKIFIKIRNMVLRKNYEQKQIIAYKSKVN